MNTIMVTEQELHAAFRQWTIDTRVGNTLSNEQVAEMSADEVAAGNVRALLQYVEQVRAAA